MLTNTSFPGRTDVRTFLENAEYELIKEVQSSNFLETNNFVLSGKSKVRAKSEAPSCLSNGRFALASNIEKLTLSKEF